MDSLEIKDIRVYGYTGALPEETVLGQWFRVDLTLWMDLETAGQTDHLDQTHDYRGAIAAVHRLVRDRPFKLIEALASAILRAVLETDPRLQRVQVRLTKTPPIPDFTGQVTVQMVRDRHWLSS
ncbi:MAG: dihydroneopterin aldolase [Leptolyngbya sp.]|nr:dihydroneopterin aldolase [Leptolyngbya sp.]